MASNIECITGHIVTISRGSKSGINGFKMSSRMSFMNSVSEVSKYLDYRTEQLIIDGPDSFNYQTLPRDVVTMLIMYRLSPEFEVDQCKELLEDFSKAVAERRQQRDRLKALVSSQSCQIYNMSFSLGDEPAAGDISVFRQKASKILARATHAECEIEKLEAENRALRRANRNRPVETFEVPSRFRHPKPRVITESAEERAFRETLAAHQTKLTHMREENETLVRAIGRLEKQLATLEARINLMAPAAAGRREHQKRVSLADRALMNAPKRNGKPVNLLDPSPRRPGDVANGEKHERPIQIAATKRRLAMILAKKQEARQAQKDSIASSKSLTGIGTLDQLEEIPGRYEHLVAQAGEKKLPPLYKKNGGMAGRIGQSFSQEPETEPIVLHQKGVAGANPGKGRKAADARAREADNDYDDYEYEYDGAEGGHGRVIGAAGNKGKANNGVRNGAGPALKGQKRAAGKDGSQSASDVHGPSGKSGLKQHENAGSGVGKFARNPSKSVRPKGVAPPEGALSTVGGKTGNRTKVSASVGAKASTDASRKGQKSVGSSMASAAKERRVAQRNGSVSGDYDYATDVSYSAASNGYSAPRRHKSLQPQGASSARQDRNALNRGKGAAAAASEKPSRLIRGKQSASVGAKVGNGSLSASDNWSDSSNRRNEAGVRASKANREKAGSKPNRNVSEYQSESASEAGSSSRFGRKRRAGEVPQSESAGDIQQMSKDGRSNRRAGEFPQSESVGHLQQRARRVKGQTGDFSESAGDIESGSQRRKRVNGRTGDFSESAGDIESGSQRRKRVNGRTGDFSESAGDIESGSQRRKRVKGQTGDFSESASGIEEGGIQRRRRVKGQTGDFSESAGDIESGSQRKKRVNGQSESESAADPQQSGQKPRRAPRHAENSRQSESADPQQSGQKPRHNKSHPNNLPQSESVGDLQDSKARQTRRRAGDIPQSDDGIHEKSRSEASHDNPSDLDSECEDSSKSPSHMKNSGPIYSSPGTNYKRPYVEMPFDRMVISQKPKDDGSQSTRSEPGAKPNQPLHKPKEPNFLTARDAADEVVQMIHEFHDVLRRFKDQSSTVC